MSQTEEKREGFYLSEDGEWVPDGWSFLSFEKIVDTEDGDRGKNYPKSDSFKGHGHCLFLSTTNVCLLYTSPSPRDRG